MAPTPPASPRTVTQGRRTAARVIAILSAAVAIGLCGLGLILAFFANDPQTGQAGSQDMVVGSGILCFCPGLLALVLAGALWLFVVRRS